MTASADSFLLLSSTLVAIPPPHLFINVRAARVVDSRTLKVEFDFGAPGR